MIQCRKQSRLCYTAVQYMPLKGIREKGWAVGNKALSSLVVGNTALSSLVVDYKALISMVVG